MMATGISPLGGDAFFTPNNNAFVSQTLRRFAENILLTNSLEEKLTPPQKGLVLDPPTKSSFQTPDLPGRPADLLPGKASQRTKFPSSQQLRNEEQRSTLLHFFCNHELIAVELMALALLKFPDAPDEFRRGLLQTLTDEQKHVKMYLKRMQNLGVNFGDHSLSKMIWDHVSKMESPLDYVSSLSLTFEQANLDYAHHYSRCFSEIGDTATANLLSTIYKDEIAHVGYGLQWLRRFKEKQQSDWDAWNKSLHFPLSPIRAKGNVPFNYEGRRAAGFDDEFIQQVELFQRSRGRTPTLHFFNPNAEREALADLCKLSFVPTPAEHQIEEDLEALIMANACEDDCVLLRTPPSTKHLIRLKRAGFPTPEVLPLSELTMGDQGRPDSITNRTFGGLQPWAWTGSASELLRPLAKNLRQNAQNTWQPPFPSHFFSKQLVLQLNDFIELPGISPQITFSTDETLSKAAKLLQSGPILLKSAYSCAGRGNYLISKPESLSHAQPWIESRLNLGGGLLIELFYNRSADFSALYDFPRSGPPKFLAFSAMRNTTAGQYQGSLVAPKISGIFDPSVCAAFHQIPVSTSRGKTSILQFYQKVLPPALSLLLPDYHGPMAVDAFFYRKHGQLNLRPVVEINARSSMGRIAHNLRLKLAPGRPGVLQLHPIKSLTQTSLQTIKSATDFTSPFPINDPSNARSLLATWQTL